jgi:5-hydroxyisourate hydrolase-like protein (transthyretin family)
MSESKKITVRLTTGVSAQDVEIDLKTASDSDLQFLWEVVKNEDAREELKLRTGVDPAKNLFSMTREDLDYFSDWVQKNPEKYQELYGSQEIN